MNSLSRHIVNVLVFSICVSQQKPFTIAQDFQGLVEKHGCMECHEPGTKQVGPAFHEIAARYRDDAAAYGLEVVSASSIAELPERKYSSVILARMEQGIHIRVFDRQGKMVINRSEHLPNNELHAAVGRFQDASTQARKAIGKTKDELASQQLKRSVFEFVGFSKSWHRQSLIEKVRQGGKGNWKEISHGVPMPSFRNRLKPEEIERLLDGILSTTVLKVMNQGLGSGIVTSNPAGINCGGTCDQIFSGPTTVTLTATANPGSRFVRWEGDASGGATTCSVTMDEDRSVRAWFELDPAPATISDFSPEGIRDFMIAHPDVNTPARFLRALPEDYKQNWILMTRSESLQTGTATSPRILLPGAEARSVFTIGLTPHISYPGSDPNAIEYMQWDESDKNFRFHEIVLRDIPAISVTMPDGTSLPTFPQRPRGINIDDTKCFRCHSTNNVINKTLVPGTTGITPGTVKFKSKPNWDSYDSWGGMMPFNRDRLYQGSIEASAFRKTLNPWTWRNNRSVGEIIEQLELQPTLVSPDDRITHHQGGTYDGYVQFAFDDGTFPVLVEPVPVGDPFYPDIDTNYAFDGRVGTGATSTVVRHGRKSILFDSVSPNGSEGRGVELFDILGGLDGRFNQRRIADELASHRVATGNVPIDVRPIVLAIQQRFVSVDATANAITSTVPLTIPLSFFTARNGMTINELVADTKDRARTLPRRKVDLQHRNLNRIGDPWLSTLAGGAANGMILEFGIATSTGVDTSLGRLRQEIFRRPIDDGQPDITVMNNFLPGYFVDRELYSRNTEKMALFRFFLEPLGVSVDKWSMSVRGRSRTYTLADVFDEYLDEIHGIVGDSVVADSGSGITDPQNESQVIAAVNRTLSTSALPPPDAVPTYTDVQRIFNRACIECHGGLNYPPYGNYSGALDLSEDENPSAGDHFGRFRKSYDAILSRTTPNPATSRLYTRITRPDELTLPRLMPFEGPALSKSDVETIRRWILGGRPSTVGDPHIRTVDGVNYDFQAVGEFVFLRDVGYEIQVRQSAVATQTPLGPNPHTGLTACVSINTAVALRVGRSRITYQSNSQGPNERPRLQLRVDGQLRSSGEPIPLSLGGRIVPTIATSGIQIEIPGGTVIVVTPGFWEHQNVWYLNIDCRHARATEGLMGTVAPGNWLPALPDGTLLGPRPEDLLQRHQLLYEKFGNAWRVTDTNSLFDYATGTSTKNFVLKDWPTFGTTADCKIPEAFGGPGVAPQEPLTREVAEQLCQEIVDPDRKRNAIVDVMVTGERGFAKTYLMADKIERNNRPTPPILLSPNDDATEVATDLQFKWEGSTDGDGDAIRYRHYVWSNDEIPNDNLAEIVPQSNSRYMSEQKSALRPGQVYFWKVIAEDGKGGTVESETRQFTVKK